MFLPGRLKCAEYSEMQVYLTKAKQYRNIWPSLLPFVSLLHLDLPLPLSQTAFSLFAFGSVVNKYHPSNNCRGRHLMFLYIYPCLPQVSLVK